jgi:hypothetical protein
MTNATNEPALGKLGDEERDIANLDICRYERLISLGRHCRTAYQIRRLTGDETAFYFDWLRTPHSGLVQVLRSDFKGTFEKQNLVLTEGGTLVTDLSNGIGFRHIFSKLPEQNTIDPTAIDREYSTQHEKLNFLAARWHQAIRRHSILFVRQDTPSTAQAAELYDALLSQTGSNPIALLIVVPPSCELTVDHPCIFVERGDEFASGKKDWKGADEIWCQILSKYWSGARRDKASGDGAFLKSG